MRLFLCVLKCVLLVLNIILVVFKIIFGQQANVFVEQPAQSYCSSSEHLAILSLPLGFKIALRICIKITVWKVTNNHCSLDHCLENPLVQWIPAKRRIIPPHKN